MEEYNIPSAIPTECCVTHRTFEPGEEYIAALFQLNGNYQRKDYSLEGWAKNPPEKYAAMWKARIPSKDEPHKSRTAINDVLLALFDQLRERYEFPEKLYVLSLLLVRRHIMQMEEQFDENAVTTLRLYHPQRDEYYNIPIANPTPEIQAEIQAELTAILVGNQPEIQRQSTKIEKDLSEIQIWNPDEIEFPEVELPPELQTHEKKPQTNQSENQTKPSKNQNTNQSPRPNANQDSTQNSKSTPNPKSNPKPNLKTSRKSK